MSDPCSRPGLMPVAQAQQSIQSGIKTLSDQHVCNLADALGRVTAVDVVSPMNVPPFDNSAMDGYAIRHQDIANHDTFEVAGKAMAGQPFAGVVEAGQCVRIMTGGTLPTGADTVVMQENTVLNENGHMQLTQAPKVSDAVRYAGEDIAVGATVVAKGKRLSAVDLGLLASLGISEVAVLRQPRVAVITTGDELMLPGQPLEPGCIYESNSVGLKAMLSKLGAEVIDFGIVADDKAKLREAFADADRQADMVISCGGVSVGEADYTKQVLQELGHIDFWKLAIKPGKPLAFGHMQNSVFFGLPGNPVSAMVTFHHLAVPALRQLSGEQSNYPLQLAARADEGFRKAPGRADLQRGICWSDEAGQLQVKPNGRQGSGILSSLAKANCFVVLEQDRGRVEPGESVTITLFDALLSAN